MKIDSHTHRPRTGNGFSGRLLPSVPEPDMEFQARFFPKDGKYGSLGICTFFPAQKNAQVMVCGIVLYHLGQNFIRSFLA
jgi:hypothetical protein